MTDLAAPFQLSRPTIHDYVTLLERVFLVEELPPWHSNRLSRLVKSPRLHVSDTGVAATLPGLHAGGLRKFASAAGQRFAAGVVLYDGETSATFGDHLDAVPIRALWEER